MWEKNGKQGAKTVDRIYKIGGNGVGKVREQKKKCAKGKVRDSQILILKITCIILPFSSMLGQ